MREGNGFIHCLSIQGTVQELNALWAETVVSGSLLENNACDREKKPDL